MCDHPGASGRDYADHMRQLIQAFGWAVQGVERDGVHPPWAYTVGLTAHQRPELVITGMSLTPATMLLNSVAARLVHASAPEPGTQVTLHDGPLVEVVTVTRPWAHLNMAVEFYGNRISALQLVHADRRGRWPWDRQYQGGRGGQPVLGARETPELRSQAGGSPGRPDGGREDPGR